MSRQQIEQRLTEVGAELRRLRSELAVADEQVAYFADAEQDARLRAMVSETPLADREHRDAQRHADAMSRDRAAVRSEIAELERLQDELLDRLSDKLS